MGQDEAIVCDTNVLVSALGWRGPERQLYDACRRGQVRLITSAELLEELERTLHYDEPVTTRGSREASLTDLLDSGLPIVRRSLASIIRNAKEEFAMSKTANRLFAYRGGPRPFRGRAGFNGERFLEP